MAVVVLERDHYWPGANIPTPQSAEGAECSWNNAFVHELPPGPFPLWQGPGWDADRPTDIQQNGGYTVVFNIVGEGKSVDFYCRSSKVGNVMTLWAPGHDEERQVVSGYTFPWVAYSGAMPYHWPPDTAGFHGGTSAIRHTLTAGVTYYLEIGSSSYDGDAPSGTGFDQDFWLETYYTPVPNNDHRADPYDVIIWDDGMTYHAVPVLNTDYTQSRTGGTDDPNVDPTLGWTAWWKYVPTKDGAIDVSWAVIPQQFDWFRLDVWRKNSGDSAPVLLASSDHQPSNITVTGLHTDDNIFFRIGSRNPEWNIDPGSSGSQPAAQKYQLEVTGAKSKVQLPTPAPGSGGDGDGAPAADSPSDSATDTPASTKTPSATNPADAKEKTCSTVLDLIREFQAKSGYAVRIVGASSIELVDPNQSLPAGFVNGQAHRYFSETEQDLAADSRTLRLNAGLMDLNATGELVADDVGIVTSGWLIPRRLPFPGLGVAPVKAVRYSFTPDGFRASVEFAFEDVPLAARRIP